MGTAFQEVHISSVSSTSHIRDFQQQHSHRRHLLSSLIHAPCIRPIHESSVVIQILNWYFIIIDYSNIHHPLSLCNPSIHHHSGIHRRFSPSIRRGSSVARLIHDWSIPIIYSIHDGNEPLAAPVHHPYIAPCQSHTRHWHIDKHLFVVGYQALMFGRSRADYFCLVFNFSVVRGH